MNNIANKLSKLIGFKIGNLKNLKGDPLPTRESIIPVWQEASGVIFDGVLVEESAGDIQLVDTSSFVAAGITATAVDDGADGVVLRLAGFATMFPDVVVAGGFANTVNARAHVQGTLAGHSGLVVCDQKTFALDGADLVITFLPFLAVDTSPEATACEPLGVGDQLHITVSVRP